MVLVKQIAIWTVLMTFLINPVFACCHAGASPVEESMSTMESVNGSSHKGCHDAEPSPSDEQPQKHNPMEPMDCAGCVQCDAYYQKYNEIALKALVAELPSGEKTLTAEASLQVDVALWTSARLRPPSLAPPVQLSPVQLNNILIL